MKTRIFFFITVIFLVSSCISSSYFQLYKTKSNSAQHESEGMVVENKDIKVIYNFWEDAGNSNFLLFNKTDSDIFIDLRKSHLILNGIANTYFQNRTISESSSSSFSSGGTSTTSNYKGISSALLSGSHFDGYGSASSLVNSVAALSSLTTKNKSTVSEGYAVTKIEQDIICIPANAAKTFSGFSLNNSLFRDCDLLRFPTKKKITTKRFNNSSTPLTIKNIIAYGFDENMPDSFKSIEADFWVSEITNYPESEFTESRYSEFCEEKSKYKKKYFLFDSPERFYIEYEKGTVEVFEH